MDPSTQPPGAAPINRLDALVALMQDNAEIRQQLLAATSHDGITAILRKVNPSLAGGPEAIDPEALRDAFRSS